MITLQIYKTIFDPLDPILSTLLGGSAGVAVTAMVFEALVPDATDYSMTGVSLGTGDLTVSRTTVSYLKDHEDVYREVLADEPVWQDGRQVVNLYSYTEDFTNALWLVANGATKVGATTVDGVDCMEISMPANNNAALWYNSIVLPTGEPAIIQARLRAKSNSKKVRLMLSGSPPEMSGDLTLDDTWKWYTLSDPSIGTPDVSSGIRNDSVGVAGNFYISAIQIENSTGRSDTTTPSEYVPNDTANPSATHIVTGANSDMSGANSWTNTGLATLDINSTVPGKMYMLGDGGAELAQLITLETGKTYYVTLKARLNTGASTTIDIGTSFATPSSIFSITPTATEETYTGIITATSTAIVIGSFTGFNGVAFEIDDFTVQEATTGRQVFGNANGNSVASNVVTEAVGSALSPQPSLLVAPALTNDALSSRDLTTTWGTVGTMTRTYNQIGLTGEPNTASLIDNTDATLGNVNQNVTVNADTNVHTVRLWVKKDTDTSRFPGFAVVAGSVKASSTLNTSTGATTLTPFDTDAQNVDVEDAGDWWIVYLEGVGDGATTSLNLRVYPAWNSVYGNTFDVNATGSIIVGNVEFYENKTIAEVRGAPPIFTTSGAVTTGVQTTSFDLANHSDTSGAYYFEWIPAVSQFTGTNESLGLLAKSEGTPFMVTRNLWLNQVSVSDGTTTVSASNINWVAGGVYKTGFIWHTDDNKRIIGVNGTFSAEGTYDGDMQGSGPLYVLKETGPFRTVNMIRNLKRAEGGDYASLKAWVDTEMA